MSRYCTEICTVQLKNRRELSNEQRKQVLEEYHYETGHGSVKTMMAALEGKYKWESIGKDVKEKVKRCCICARNGELRQNTKNKVLETSHPNELWICDLIGRIPTRNGKSKFIFLAIDHYTKWVEARVLETKSKSEIINSIEELIIKKHGKPKAILTDNGKEFTSDDFKALLGKHQIERRNSSPYHHETMGSIERANQTLWRKLRKLAMFGKKNWERYVGKAVWAMNISLHRGIGTSAFIMKHLRTPDLSIDKVMGIPQTDFQREELEAKRNTIK